MNDLGLPLPTDQQPPRVELRGQDREADITVEVASDPADESKFDVLVTSPNLPDYDDSLPERWSLRKRAADLVSEYMEDITIALEPGQLQARIIGLGKKLFADAPKSFRDLYWRLTDDGIPPRTILVQSEEWAIPWELMVPFRRTRDNAQEIQPPLGFQLAIGRWLAKDGIAPLQSIKLDDSYVFAPKYPRRLRLRHSDAEIDLVCNAFAGQRIRDRQPLDSALSNRSVALLHFTCHGEARVPPVQAILLERDGRLLSYELSGMEGLARAVAETRPMVFLNTCEVGRPAPSLIGVGGFAMEFIELGARCVVAPLWSVDDTVAGEVAKLFYSRVIATPAPRLADIMSEVRRLSFTRDEDSYAAYAFYGDPLGVHA